MGWRNLIYNTDNLNFKYLKYYGGYVMAENEIREKKGEDHAESKVRKMVDGSTKSRKKRAFKKEMKNSKRIMTVVA